MAKQPDKAYTKTEFGPGVLFPWDAEPSGMGSRPCTWCGRDIPIPATPCSVTRVAGIKAMQLPPGRGARCQWEHAVRSPSVSSEASSEA